MKVELRERTEETVRIYFETVRRQGLDRTLPQRAKTAEEAVEDYCLLYTSPSPRDS